MKDDYLYISLVMEIRKSRNGFKNYTPLGLPYIFKRNNVAINAWTPEMPNTFVEIDNGWVEDGMTPDQDCALWLDQIFSKQHPVGYYGA